MSGLRRVLVRYATLIHDQLRRFLKEFLDDRGAFLRRPGESGLECDFSQPDPVPSYGTREHPNMRRTMTIQSPGQRIQSPFLRTPLSSAYLRRRRGWRAGGLIASSVAMLSMSVSASESSSPDESADGRLASQHAWFLYGAPEIGIYAHTGKGNSTSTNITGPRVNPSNGAFGDLGVQISAPERSRELVASFLAGGTVGALTPGLDLPGRPRAFFELNLSVAQTTESQLARRGNPGTIDFPSPNRPGTPIGEGAMIGNGTQLSVQQQGPQVHAGMGISLEFPISSDGELIRIKPAAFYSRTIVDLKAQTVRAVRLNGDTGINQQIDDFRTIALQDERTEVYHAGGPSLEIEYVPGIQWGPFSISVFARGHASHIFSSLKTEMQSCNTAGGQPNECARWKYTQDPWTYRATLGVHLNWIPRILW